MNTRKEIQSRHQQRFRRSKKNEDRDRTPGQNRKRTGTFGKGDFKASGERTGKEDIEAIRPQRSTRTSPLQHRHVGTPRTTTPTAQKTGGKEDELADPRHPPMAGAGTTNPKVWNRETNTGNKEPGGTGTNGGTGSRKDGIREERNMLRTEGRHARGKEK